MRTIAIVNEKGGTGKTTTAVNLSVALGEAGLKVLLVDLDGQAASSRWLGVEDDTSFADALWAGEGLRPLPEVVRNVSLAPGSGKLDSVAHDLRPTQGGQLRKLLGQVEGFDYAIIDCPPSLGNRLIGNALLAATHAIVPVETSILALDGLKILLTTFQDVRDGFGHEIILAGALACRYDARTRLSRMILEELRRALPGKVFETVIRENVRVRECPASGQSVLTYAPDSHAAEDYRALAKELIAKIHAADTPVPRADEIASAPLPRAQQQTIAEMRKQVDTMLRQFSPDAGANGKDPTGMPPLPEEEDLPAGDAAKPPAPPQMPSNGVWDLDAELGEEIENIDLGEIWGSAPAETEDPAAGTDSEEPAQAPPDVQADDDASPEGAPADAVYADHPTGPAPLRTPADHAHEPSAGDDAPSEDDETPLERWQQPVSHQLRHKGDGDGDDVYRQRPGEQIADEDLPAHDRSGWDDQPAAAEPPAEHAGQEGRPDSAAPRTPPSLPAESAEAAPPEPEPVYTNPYDRPATSRVDEEFAPAAEGEPPAAPPPLPPNRGQTDAEIVPDPFAPRAAPEPAPAEPAVQADQPPTDGPEPETADGDANQDDAAVSEDDYPALRAMLRKMRAESEGQEGGDSESPWRKLLHKAGADQSR